MVAWLFRARAELTPMTTWRSR